MTKEDFMKDVLSHIDANKQKNLDSLFECLRIESISAVAAKTPEVLRCGEWLVARLAKAGFENVALKDTGGHPAVYADWLHAGADKPTVLVYGHYDVQPVDPIEKWESPPFDPAIRDGYIYGRGTSDDKAQLLAHAYALEAFLKTKKSIPVNVKIFLEGEEEGGAGGTERFVRENTKLLSCDVVVLSDTAWPSHDLPTIIYSLRGIAYFQVHVRGPNRDLHSGVYGGKVQNPLNAMARIISMLHDENGRIAIPGIYEKVIPLTDEEKRSFASVGIDDRAIAKDIGIDAFWGEKGYTPTERNWARPALDVNGIWGGYMAEGSKTVIASDGGFKMSIRLVPDQTPEEVKELLTKYLKKICPPGAHVEVKMLHGGEPVMVKTDDPFMACAKDAVEKAFGKRPVLVREGASVPITATFKSALSATPIMMGLGLVEDNIHSPNERFRLDHFYNGIVACAHFYSNAAGACG